MGCSGPVARNLDDASANHIIVALDQRGVYSTKDSDPQNEGKWQISVPRADVPFALSVLSEEGLPARERAGVAEAAAQGELVPSPQTEKARLMSGVAGDLEKSLSQIDGVALARVHLAVPTEEPFGDAPTPKDTTASVLIRHHGKNPPVALEAIQRLVAGAVHNLAPDHVTVVAIPLASTAGHRERPLASLGPFAVARGSLFGLRLLIGGFVVLNLLMLSQLLLFWRKTRNFRTEPPPDSVPKPAKESR